MEIIYDYFSLRLNLKEFESKTNELCGVCIGVLSSYVF